MVVSHTATSVPHESASCLPLHVGRGVVVVRVVVVTVVTVVVVAVDVVAVVVVVVVQGSYKK